METKRLQLKALHTEHASFIFELVNTAGWITFIGDRHINTIEAAHTYIRKILDDPKIRYWVVCLKDTAIPVGVITLIKRDYLDHPDIGFAFLPQYGRQGFAYEAAQKVLDETGLKQSHGKISGITMKENISSLQLLKKLGFVYSREVSVEHEILLLYTKEMRPPDQ